MKQIRSLVKIGIFTAVVAAFLTTTATAQERGNKEARASPNASVSQTIGTTNVTITYGRPSVNERQIFGDLVPYDKVWRTGANESTNITFSDDVTVGGETVKTGTYSLYTIPGENEWTIILNSKLSWGTEYDESQDVVRIMAKPEKAPSAEQFMITFEDVSETSANVVMHWDETKVSFTIEV